MSINFELWLNLSLVHRRNKLSGYLSQYINLYVDVYGGTIRDGGEAFSALDSVHTSCGSTQTSAKKYKTLSYGVKRQRGDGRCSHLSSAERIRGAVPSLFHTSPSRSVKLSIETTFWFWSKFRPLHRYVWRLRQKKQKCFFSFTDWKLCVNTWCRSCMNKN